MVVIACTPCLASTLGPAALSVATVGGINSQKKKKKKNRKEKKKKKKNTSKNKKGGSGYETQEDYESMIREQNESMNEDRIRMIKQRQKEKERMNIELRRRLIRQEDMRKECDKLVRLLKSKGVSKQVAEKHAQKMFEQKLQCDSGNINACNYCKDEYIKNLRTSKKRSKTPQVPVQALPKSKSKSKSRPRKTTRRRKGPPESIAMKLHAMGRTSKLKNLKKSLTKRSPPPPIRRSKSKSKLKRTKSTGGKRSKRRR